MYAKDRTILDRREMLKIKLKCLAIEARFIRKEELKTSGSLREELALHRRGVVRCAARETHLAYGYIRGKTIEQMEKNANGEGWRAPDTAAIDKMVKKYGPVQPLKKAA